MHWNTALFSHAASSMLAAKSDQNSAAKAARDAQASRLSRPVRAAALMRRHSRHSRRLAAPGRRAATGSSSGSSEKSTESSRTAPQLAAGPPARPSLIVAMAPVVLAAWCCSESNAGEG